jgi:CHAT domain-containing protein/tetratricopeptide (TPR) repeat protein
MPMLMARALRLAMVSIGLILCAVAGPVAAENSTKPEPTAQVEQNADSLIAEVEALYRAGTHGRAAPLAERALALLEKAQGGPDNLSVAKLLSAVAGIYQYQGQYHEAEPLYGRALQIREKLLSPNHPDVEAALSDLGTLYDIEGRQLESEPLHWRALEIREKAQPPEHADMVVTRFNLAHLYKSPDQLAKTERFYQRALALDESRLGSEHPDVANSINNLADLYEVEGRYGEAERLYERLLGIYGSGLLSGSSGNDLDNLVFRLERLYRAQNRVPQVQPLYVEAVAKRTKALSDQPSDHTSSEQLASLYQSLGCPAEAESLMIDALVLKEMSLGREGEEAGRELDIAKRTAGLISLYIAQQDWIRAAYYLRQIVRQDTATVTGIVDRDNETWAKWQFFEFIKVAHHLAAEGSSAKSVPVPCKDGVRIGGRTALPPLLTGTSGGTEAARLLSGHQDDTTGLPRETFQTAQWAQISLAAQSLAQMAARGAKSDAKLAGLARERQDLAAEWRGKHTLLTATRLEPPAQRQEATETALNQRLAAIDARLTAIDATLAKEFPEYAALASPKPISADDVQSNLRDDEALVLFMDTDDRVEPLPEESFVWVVTKREVRWVRSELGTQALRKEVAALRCGLDYNGAWFDDKGAWNGGRCNALLNLQKPYGLADHDVFGKPLPFDLARSYALYKALFGDVEDLIKDKRLLIVPSGPLTQLPFQVLVTKPPRVALPEFAAGYRDVVWLVREHAITVLPAVSSLKAIRELAKESHASEKYIGFGNPLLDGDVDKISDEETTAKRLASIKLAREARCEPVQTLQTAALADPAEESGRITRGPDGLAEIADLRRWAPLPETADEVCGVANILGVDVRSHVYIGRDAREEMVKRLSKEGELAKYKIVHFATHGALAGELSPAAEPGLILTPPDKATEVDDGYLSASEVAALKLDADWVILSACNTAAGEEKSAEALSGLARAFFYAGARSLLVSHWYVASKTAIPLITTAIAMLTVDPEIGRADALRRSMLSMIDTGRDYEAHPAFWAPFVLVGEGGAAR